MDINKYRVWCNTDSKYEYVWSETVPTTCPIDTGHSIDTAKTVVVERISESGKYNADGEQIIDITYPKGKTGTKGSSIVTHDFSDRTTWYQNAVAVTDEVLSDSGNGLTWNSANANWVNIDSLKLSMRYKYVPLRTSGFGSHSTYRVVVKVDDAVQSSGYTVNFVTGDIIFDSTQAGSVVKATYYHNDSVTNRSEWILKPQAGKVLTLEHAEMQFSKTSIINGYFRMEIWAGSTLATYDAASWSDGAFDAGYGQYRMDYRGFHDFINIGNLGTGTIPVLDGLTSETCIFPFNYIKSIQLKDSQGAVLRLISEGDIQISSADIATATLYLEEADE